MIVFDITCDKDHTFEGWFKDSATFDSLVSKGEVACPVCGTTDVQKALAAPRLGGIRKGKDSPGPSPKGKGRPSPEDVGKVEAFVSGLRELKRHVEKNSTYVGDQFPEEARKIHYGEADPKSIYGEATPEEAAELSDEGVDFHRIPWPSEPKYNA